MPVSLDSEIHLHLFGCLTAEDLWKQGQRLSGRIDDRIRWFVKEYSIAYGRMPSIDLYLDSDKSTAVEKIEDEIICKDKRTFNQFQASFNLSIALFPDRLQDDEIVSQMTKRQLALGIDHSEFRMILPPFLDRKKQSEYLKRITEACSKFSDTPSIPVKILLTLFRESPDLPGDYSFIKTWRKENPKLGKYISGIDFCMDEQGDPPYKKEGFYRLLREDRCSNPADHLPLSLHIGENFSQIGCAVSCSWLIIAMEMGVPRLGHALAMGVAHEDLEGSSFNIPIQYRVDFLNWVLRNHSELLAYHYPDSIEDVKKELSEMEKKSQTQINLAYDEVELRRVHSLQEYAIHIAKKHQTHIECCPTSNFVLGPIKKFKNHPIKRYLNHGLNVSLSSDDPGLFSTNLIQERKRCQDEFSFTEKDFSTLNKNAENIFTLYD